MARQQGDRGGRGGGHVDSRRRGAAAAHLSVRPARDAELAAALLEHRHANAKLRAGGCKGSRRFSAAAAFWRRASRTSTATSLIGWWKCADSCSSVRLLLALGAPRFCSAEESESSLLCSARPASGHARAWRSGRHAPCPCWRRGGAPRAAVSPSAGVAVPQVLSVQPPRRLYARERAAVAHDTRGGRRVTPPPSADASGSGRRGYDGCAGGAEQRSVGSVQPATGRAVRRPTRRRLRPRAPRQHRPRAQTPSMC